MVIVDLIGKLAQSKPWVQRQPESIDTLVIHHSAAPAPRDAVKQLRAFAAHHISQGYRGLAYHYAIAQDGAVYKCNRASDITSHAAGGNAKSIGIVLLGNFDTHAYSGGELLPSVPTGSQIISARELVHQLREAYPSITTIVPHRSVKGSKTACPGRYFTNEMVRALWADH